MKHNKKDMIKESNLTYDDYASINDGNRYELVQGQLELMSPSPSTIHQLILSELDFLISLTCKKDYFILFSPIDLILSKNEVRQPDLVLINRQRIDILTKRGVEGSPDLVVEILSPNLLKRDRIDKLKTYEQYEIPEYWIIDPTHQTLEIWHAKCFPKWWNGKITDTKMYLFYNETINGQSSKVKGLITNIVYTSGVIYI